MLMHKEEEKKRVLKTFLIPRRALICHKVLVPLMCLGKSKAPERRQRLLSETANRPHTAAMTANHVGLAVANVSGGTLHPRMCFITVIWLAFHRITIIKAEPTVRVPQSRFPFTGVIFVCLHLLYIEWYWEKEKESFRRIQFRNLHLCAYLVQVNTFTVICMKKAMHSKDKKNSGYLFRGHANRNPIGPNTCSHYTLSYTYRRFNNT